MQIRNKLSLYFTITSSALMLLIMLFVYLLFSSETSKDFYRALHERALVAAQLYLEADEISPGALEKIKKEFVTSLPQEVIRVYDSTDKLSFMKDTKRNWSPALINRVRAEKYISYEEEGNQVVGISYDDNQGNFVILVEARDIYGREREMNLGEIMGAIFIIQLLIQFLAGRWLAQKTLEPIIKINAQVQKISATDLHLRLEGDNEKDELGILAANFNDLLSRLEHSFDLQKLFVANASHELKTPVTNIIGEIEVALDKKRSADEYEQNLGSILVEANLLNEIIRNCLLLANTENNGTVEKKESVRLDELLWEIKENLWRKNGVTLQMQLDELPQDESQLYLSTDKNLLSLAIGNIIQNGSKFSDGKPVTCSLHFTQDTLSISIADAGIGMDHSVLDDIFEPFYRSAEAARYKGHGMGLYITKRIIELLGGQIEVSSQKGTGSVFNIVFARIAPF